MYAALFILSIAGILYALSIATEKVLAIRQRQREKGTKPFLYL